MEHPFIGSLADKTMEELTESISTLNKRLSFAYRMNRPDIINQLQMALESYRGEMGKRQAALWEKHAAKSGKDFGKNIDIG
jgi:hypothetical protein